MEASSSSRRQRQRQRKMGWKGKTIYICFSGEPMGYAIRYVSQFDHHFLHKETRPLLESSLSELHAPHLTPPPPLSEVWRHYGGDERSLPQGCVLLDSKVFFVGSAYPKPGSSGNKSLICYNLADRSVTFYPGMSVRYNPPIVFSAKNMIFVLSDPNRKDLYEDKRYRITNPSPAFEVFNLSTQKWETLVPPPFYDPQSDYYLAGFRMTGHAVIGGYFCVSTGEVSSKFKVDVDFDDVKKMIWEPCMLFQDHPDPHISSTRCTARTLLTSSTPFGRPFPFRKRAILFGDGDDILISMASNKLVAYKMDGDRVVKSQSFDVPGVTDTCSFSDIGDGLLFIVSTGVYYELGDYYFDVKLLRLNKKKEDKEEFLQCEVVNEFFYHFVETEMWFPCYCFAR